MFKYNTIWDCDGFSACAQWFALKKIFIYSLTLTLHWLFITQISKNKKLNKREIRFYFQIIILTFGERRIFILGW
jgi:hypothetical protein